LRGAAGSTGWEPAGIVLEFAAREGSEAGSNPVIVSAIARESGQETVLANMSPIVQGVTPPAQSGLVDANSANHGFGLAPQSDGSAGAGSAGPWSGGRGRSEHATLIRASNHSAVDPSTRVDDTEADDLPGPSRADLIASVFPLDSAAIDRVIDQLFRQLNDFGVSDRPGRGPERIVLVSLAVTGSVVALEVIRRRWRRWSAGSEPQIDD
jgi:hypothetical protein